MMMNDADTINSGDFVSGLNIVDTTDIPTQLANINYRLDILITIALYVLICLCSVGVCYLLYRFILRFI